MRHFFAYKLPGAAARFARDDFADLRSICKRWSPDWTPSDEELAPVRECFADEASREAAFGYYRALAFVQPRWLKTRIAVPTVVFSGTGDPNADRRDYERGGSLFDGPYTIEEMPGGHFMHREHPEVFAERLLAHL